MTTAERPPSRDQPGIEEWRGQLRKVLGERDVSEIGAYTRDGIVIEPLYERRREGVPVPGRRAQVWRIVQIVDDPDPDQANRQALTDLENGATGLSIRLEGAPSASAGGLPVDEASLRDALAGVDLAKVHLRLEPHAEATTVARWLADFVETSGVAPEIASIAFGLDPITAIATQNGNSGDVGHVLVDCAHYLLSAHFRGTLAALDARAFHEAGASEAQELAAILAAATWWMRTLGRAEIAPSESVPPFGASLAVGRDQFVSVAKLRALRLLWARLLELCQVDPHPLPVHVETSRRMLTRADPTTNLLRTTLAAFAAGVGGADSITVLPHTVALGHPDGDARALACNIQHLLMEEAHLHRVTDPGAGSGAIEALTDALAEHAWAEFQAIEREGGVVESLRAGLFQARIAEARARLAKEIAEDERPLVGATVYPVAREAGFAAAPASRNEPLATLGLAPIALEDFAGEAA